MGGINVTVGNGRVGAIISNCEDIVFPDAEMLSKPDFIFVRELFIEPSIIIKFRGFLKNG